MSKVVLWFFGVLAVVGIISSLASNTPTPSPEASQQIITVKAPNHLAEKRQRIAGDPRASADLKRLQSIDGSLFCWRELPKIRTAKLSSPQIEAYMLTAYEHGVTQSEQDSIQQKAVTIGMSKCGAIASWGRPQKINSSSGANYSQEQWVYGGGNYLYIRNHKVSSSQTSR